MPVWQELEFQGLVGFNALACENSDYSICMSYVDLVQPSGCQTSFYQSVIRFVISIKKLLSLKEVVI